MERITVVFDLDDVLFDFVTPFFEWHNRRYGTDLTPEDLATAKYLFEAWGGTKEEAIERLALFFREVDVLGLKPIPGAVECLEGLQAKYQLAVVSARDPDFAAVTEAWIEKYFAGVFDPVILGVGHSERGERPVTKASVCRQIRAGVLVDDQVAHLTGAAEEGLRALLFGRYPWNQTQPLPPNALRVADWSEVCAALT
ncbi:MAG: hypothetical protein ACE5MI_09645 [Acidimicrobiia bacterium]